MRRKRVNQRRGEPLINSGSWKKFLYHSSIWPSLGYGFQKSFQLIYVPMIFLKHFLEEMHLIRFCTVAFLKTIWFLNITVPILHRKTKGPYHTYFNRNLIEILKRKNQNKFLNFVSTDHPYSELIIFIIHHIIVRRQNYQVV